MIALLIPVLGRPHQIKPLYENIKQATVNENQVVFIFSPGDEAIAAAADLDAKSEIVSWQPGKADYAKKLAVGFHANDEPWLFQGATDLLFHPGWDAAAFQAAKRTNVGVIGTNDLGHPFVKRGLHSTHSLFTRDYINEWGGVADGTGLIFSEAYDHQWTDNEFIDTARLRKKYLSAKRSIVEHNHPHWGKAESDTTYEKATRDTNRDQKLYMSRRPKVTRHVQEQLRHKK